MDYIQQMPQDALHFLDNSSGQAVSLFTKQYKLVPAGEGLAEGETLWGIDVTSLITLI